jgi:hypothetical protein
MLRQDSAPGPDGITMKLLKNQGDGIMEPLEIIYKNHYRNERCLWPGK